MFEKMGDWMQQMKLMKDLASNKDIQQFMMHPKVQKVFQDPHFQEIVKDKDIFKLMSHPEFAELLKDPEIRELMQKIQLSGPNTAS